MKIHVKTKKARVELIPLLDMIFLVLVCFVYNFIFISPAKGIKVSLPVSKEAVVVEQENIVLSLTADEFIYFNDNMITERELKRRLKGQYREYPDIKVFVNADKGVRYQSLIELIDIIKDAGIEKVSLQTEIKNE